MSQINFHGKKLKLGPAIRKHPDLCAYHVQSRPIPINSPTPQFHSVWNNQETYMQHPAVMSSVTQYVQAYPYGSTTLLIQQQVPVGYQTIYNYQAYPYGSTTLLIQQQVSVGYQTIYNYQASRRKAFGKRKRGGKTHEVFHGHYETVTKKPLLNPIPEMTEDISLISSHQSTPVSSVSILEPIVSPVVPEKAENPKPVETVFKIPSRNAADSNLEISLTGPIPEDTFHPVLLKRGKKKKVRLSAFERAVDKQLPATTAKSFLDNTSLTGSLQVTLGTPVTPLSNGKRGLIRRPKSYKGVNVMTFEGGMEQNLVQIKGSQNHLVDLHASALSNATETIYANTELFAHSQLSGQGRQGLHVLPSEPAAAGKSSSQKIMLSSVADLQTPQRHAESDTDAGMTWQDQKYISMPEIKCVDGTEGVPEEKADSPRKEQQESEPSVEGGMTDSILKETLSPGIEPFAGVDAVPQQRTLSLGRKQEGSLHGDSPMEQQGSLCGDRLMEQQGSLHGDRLMELHSSPEEHHLSDISTPKSSTPVDTELPAVLASGLRAFLQDKPTKRSVKAIVEHIIKELDKNMAPCVVGQGASEADLEEEPSANAGATRISQRTGVGTPRRSVSGQGAEQVERESIDEAIQQPGDESKPRELSDLESDADVVSEIEMEPEVEDVSEAEMDSENNEPPVKTPAFVRTKAFQCTPLLSSPRTPKAVSKSASKQPSKKQVPKESKKAHREKRQPGLSSSWVKKMFSHYAKMPVAKDAFQAVERCVSLYFKHLSDDLETYANHARRKTIELADMELLMRRQGLVTDKIPLNVLIERHLPLEYRKLLIPVATSGNKVIPLHPR